MDDPVTKAESKNEFGNILYGLKQYGNAIHAYTSAIQICPQIAKYYGNRSACYLMLNEFVKAQNDARKSTELDNGYKKGYIRIGKCCLATGNVKYAENILERAKGIFPGDKEILDMHNDVKCILENLQQYEIKMKNKQYAEALNYIERCIERAPFCIKYITNKGRCFIYLQRFEEAERLADEILKYKSTDEEAVFIKASVKIYQEDIELATQLSKELKKKLPDHSATTQLFRSSTMIHQNDQKIKNALKEKNYSLAHELITKTIKIDDSRKFLNKKLYKQKIEIAGKDRKLLWNGVDDCTNYMHLYGKDKEILKTRVQYNIILEEFEDAVEDYKELLSLEDSNEIKQKLKTAEKNFENQLKDDHKILKINVKCTESEIKNAGKELMKRYHPDKNKNASPERKKMLEKKLIRVREAQNRLLQNFK